MTAELFRTLFDYNHWANEKVLGEASQVETAQYYAGVPGLSFGSLHATLVHILVAELVWLPRWQSSLPPEALKGCPPSGSSRRNRDQVVRGVVQHLA